jgi:hypothetical protein
MRQQIEQRFEATVARVENLITLYENSAGSGSGRRPVNSSDILRAAVVMLHSSLEEVFRGIAEWKYPSAAAEVLDKVPLVGVSEHGRPTKFLLGHLVPHREKRVAQLISESVRAYLDTFTINNTGDIAGFCQTVGIAMGPPLQNHFGTLNELMSRRHHIVHQADRNESIGSGHHTALSLGAQTVRTWVNATRDFVGALLGQIPD